MSDKKEKLGEVLIRQGILSQDKLVHALDEQKKSEKLLGEILVEKGFVSEEDVAKILADQLGLPFISISDIEIDPTLRKVFTPKKMKECKVFPVKLEGDLLTVAVVNPLDIKMIQDLKYESGHRITLAITTSKDILDCLHWHFGSSADLQEALEDISGKNKDFVSGFDLRSLEQAVQDAPVVKLVNSVLTEAINQKASDIHFEPQRHTLRIRYRVDGVLRETLSIPKELQLAVTSRIKIISNIDIAEMRKPQDGRMSFTLGAKSYDLRTSTLPDSFGEKVVLRILDKTNAILNFEHLGLDEKEQKILEELIRVPYGIILNTGPTGSGKTTSLYAMLNALNDETRNIVTVENPIEYQLDGINQTEVNERAGYTFATGLRHILRQDPDVIMIGEIRDLETAEIAVQAALTGHLVLSTLHTNSAAGSVVRLIDMNIEPFLIGSAVCGILAQRLVRKLCPYCAQKQAISDDIRKIVGSYLKDFDGSFFMKAVGCQKCQGVGYQGRSAIFEMMKITPEIKELIVRKATETEVENMALFQGMRTLQMRALEKASEGVTSLEEAMRVTFIRTGS